MDRLIIGIHGLNNKPPEKILKIWWELSLRHGLQSCGYDNPAFRFELLYWADLCYHHPLDQKVTDKENPRFIAQPFKELTPPSPHKSVKRKALDSLEKVTDRLMHNKTLYNNFESFSEYFIRRRFRDLDIYLNNRTGYREAQDQPVRTVILKRFFNLLKKYHSKKIMIIAHSMGSIIVYDALKQLDQHYSIDTLVTAGSPLGQPTLIGKLIGDNPFFTQIKTPERVHAWYNLSALYDLVALNYSLHDDFSPNSKGVLPKDLSIQNTYTWEETRNAHSVYGYLQSPECARLVNMFLQKEKSRFSLWWARKNQTLQDTLLLKRKRMINYSKPRPELVREKHKKHKSISDYMKFQLNS